MSETPEHLTEQHRQAQLDVRTHALRDFLLLWPLWTGDSQSFARLVQAAQPLIQVYRGASTALAAAYYRAHREAEGVPGEATVRLAADLPRAQIASSLYVTGDVMTRDALNAGQSPAKARETALTRVSGAVTRHVLSGGRQTLLDSVAADPQALGWARVTDSAPCAFCAALAARGAIYKSEGTADFEAHDHCACQAVPTYDGSTPLALNNKWRDLYDRAQREAEASGELKRGTSNDRLNAFRRLLEAER